MSTYQKSSIGICVVGFMFQQYGSMIIQYTYVVLDLFFPNTRMEKIIKVGQQMVVEIKKHWSLPQDPLI